MESGHALSNHPPWGCCSSRNPPKPGGLGAAWAEAVMDGCALTPEDDWKAEKDRLQTQMGFDTDSELVPCHLIDGGRREIEEGRGWNRGRGEREKRPGEFLKWIYLYHDQRKVNRDRGEVKRQRNLLPFRDFSAKVKVKFNFTQHLQLTCKCQVPKLSL